jgi:hypothetical protein
VAARRGADGVVAVYCDRSSALHGGCLNGRYCQGSAFRWKRAADPP